MAAMQNPLRWVTDRNPSIPGLYQTRDGLGIYMGFQRWDGKNWYTWNESPHRAWNSTRIAARDTQGDPWVTPCYEEEPSPMPHETSTILDHTVTLTGPEPQELMAKIKAILGGVVTPLGYTTSPITWSSRQTEQVRKITKHPQLKYGFSHPIYGHPPQWPATVERYVWEQYADCDNGPQWVPAQAIGYDPRSPEYSELHPVDFADKTKVRGFKALYHGADPAAKSNG